MIETFTLAEIFNSQRYQNIGNTYLTRQDMPL